MPNVITRRRVIFAAGAGILVPFGSYAQPAKKIPVIGILHPGSPPPSPSLHASSALEKGLRGLGYVDGKTITLEYRYGRGKADAMPGLATELAARKVDVLPP